MINSFIEFDNGVEMLKRDGQLKKRFFNKKITEYFLKKIL